MPAVKQPHIGRFASEEARQKFLRAYDVAMGAWPQPREEQDVDTSFGTVHVHRHGPGVGPPIVLLHGSQGNSTNWYPQVAGLGAHHPVYSLDTVDDPGRSVQRRPVTGTADCAAWIDETLAALGLTGVHLVGLSYGGFLATALAVHRPGRLASVTLIEPGGLQKVPFRFYANLIAGALATLAPRATRPWFAARLANHALLLPPEQLAPVMIVARHWRTDRPAARRFDDDELRAIPVPVQLLLAERSSLLHPQRAASRAQALIPSVRTEIVAGAGHGLPMEQPTLVNQRILDFAARCANEPTDR
ncbi:alpha/beta fold hydrolase [Micromonospora sp. NPDC049060]|uniref:alpha/beta fold hydrolase n=1 Tax=Micromonospora sp. NPDC049060 TaxID=3154828 RepID=UPI0033CD8304